MGRQSLLDRLIKENKLSSFIQMANDGKTQKEIAEAFDTTNQTVATTLAKIKEQERPQRTEEKIEQKEVQQKTAYEILYENRKKVVELKRMGLYNVDIAKAFGVQDKDVFDFLEKRTKLTPKQLKDIKKSYNNGKSIEAIAQQYNSHPETIRKICKAVVVAEEETRNEGQEDIVANLNCISEFTQFILQIEHKVNYTTDAEKKTEKEIQDLLHKIEISDCSDEEGLEILQKLKGLRQYRRECKDFLTLIEPLIEFLNDDTNSKTIKTLMNIAGRINNRAHQTQDRIYFLKTKEGE